MSPATGHAEAGAEWSTSGTGRLASVLHVHRAERPAAPARTAGPGGGTCHGQQRPLPTEPVPHEEPSLVQGAWQLGVDTAQAEAGGATGQGRGTQWLERLARGSGGAVTTSPCRMRGQEGLEGAVPMSQAGLGPWLPLGLHSLENLSGPLGTVHSHWDWPGVEGAVSPGGTHRGSPGQAFPSLAKSPLCLSRSIRGTSSGCCCCAHWSRASLTPFPSQCPSRHSTFPSQRLPVTVPSRAPCCCASSCIKGDLVMETPGPLSPWRVEAWPGVGSGFLQVLRGFRAWSAPGAELQMAVDQDRARPGPQAHAHLWHFPPSIKSNRGRFPYSFVWFGSPPRFAY